MEEKSTNRVGAPLGNDNHRKGKPFQDALRRAIAQNPQKLRNAADKVLDLAEAGEAWAVKEIADRLDGKSHQSTSLEDADGNSIINAIEVRFVKPSES
jgi:hypothetical protein